MFTELIAQSFLLGLIILSIILLITWFFIMTAVKAGTKRALIEFYQEFILDDVVTEETYYTEEEGPHI